MQLNRPIINSAILAAVVWFMRRDVTMALVVAVVAYLLTLVNF
jgi:hypothetical protein